MENRKIYYVLIGLFVSIQFQIIMLNCSNSGIKRVVNRIDKKTDVYYELNKKYMLRTCDSLMNLNRYIILRDVLYDQNAIVRTVLRPDDRINYYNKEIEKIINKK